ncbi:hypothetical protein [Alkalibacillus silvisoli]|uniref:Uncharacterized protein n=1 Tax=Alkalibacillus silvisoli TaxID=392823 RepID=A0ABP3JSJ0_9BACI
MVPGLANVIEMENKGYIGTLFWVKTRGGTDINEQCNNINPFEGVLKRIEIKKKMFTLYCIPREFAMGA